MAYTNANVLIEKPTFCGNIQYLDYKWKRFITGSMNLDIYISCECKCGNFGLLVVNSL